MKLVTSFNSRLMASINISDDVVIIMPAILNCKIDDCFSASVQRDSSPEPVLRLSLKDVEEKKIQVHVQQQNRIHLSVNNNRQLRH